MPQTETDLFTIGYSGYSAQRFVERLQEAGVNVLVDVRELPLSRKKGFSKNALRTLLEENGIEYRHIRALGVPSELRAELKNGCCLVDYLNAFRVHLDECTDAIGELRELADEKSCCLMCVEKDVDECHRSVVADRLHEHHGISLRVQHL